jgi:hypothetical protein
MPVIRLPVANTVSFADGSGKLTRRDEGEQNCLSPPQSRQLSVTASSGMLAPYQRAHHAEKSPASYLHEMQQAHAILAPQECRGPEVSMPRLRGRRSVTVARCGKAPNWRKEAKMSLYLKRSPLTNARLEIFARTETDFHTQFLELMNLREQVRSAQLSAVLQNVEPEDREAI